MINSDKLAMWPVVVTLCLCASLLCAANFTVTDKVIAFVQNKYGDRAVLRVKYWQKIMDEGKSLSDAEKLEKVNGFFNQIRFIDDIKHWKQKDYWATPVEFLGTNGGDCEDFSIAKYFTLKALGIPESQMRLTYVKAIELNQAHMVLTYFKTPGAEPLVLDNLMAEIKPASKRQDLLPVYSFNGDGLWLAKARGLGKRVGDSGRINLWKDLMRRMGQ